MNTLFIAIAGAWLPLVVVMIDGAIKARTNEDRRYSTAIAMMASAWMMLSLYWGLR
jgi:hypothetical protein